MRGAFYGLIIVVPVWALIIYLFVTCTKGG